MNYEPTDLESFDNFWKDIYHKGEKIKEKDTYALTHFQ